HQDRFPWLLKLHDVIESERRSGSDALLTCSALKRQYRQILLYGSRILTPSYSPDQDIWSPSPDVFFLFLHGDHDLLYQRLVVRRGHYMKADLLASQFDVLEPPSNEENMLFLDIRRSIPDIAMEIEGHIRGLKLPPRP
ncbi:probable gluconokinase, partial [Brachionichthys hirsutus]|uniref:probable gluconokinase n=1 Tax=Brachionichthys hirsutus TaxID=412623 RepID=UPI00360482FD